MTTPQKPESEVPSPEEFAASLKGKWTPELVLFALREYGSLCAAQAVEAATAKLENAEISLAHLTIENDNLRNQWQISDNGHAEALRRAEKLAEENERLKSALTKIAASPPGITWVGQLRDMAVAALKAEQEK